MFVGSCHSWFGPRSYWLQSLVEGVGGQWVPSALGMPVDCEVGVEMSLYVREPGIFSEAEPKGPLL